ncbi:hypothetical protein AVEN_80126-1 [Araneus ventricosus]|uniref:Uncharacterized protein n=1 Tax=Araneus ventricosus TaxID=182803 RepID=A0A4Y2R361_ARAVE|nr:hypothetical protein AVEN_80126-1 [Araneus ventricosus]
MEGHSRRVCANSVGEGESAWESVRDFDPSQTRVLKTSSGASLNDQLNIHARSEENGATRLVVAHSGRHRPGPRPAGVQGARSAEAADPEGGRGGRPRGAAARAGAADREAARDAGAALGGGVRGAAGGLQARAEGADGAAQVPDRREEHAGQPGGQVQAGDDGPPRPAEEVQDGRVRDEGEEKEGNQPTGQYLSVHKDSFGNPPTYRRLEEAAVGDRPEVMKLKDSSLGKS